MPFSATLRTNTPEKALRTWRIWAGHESVKAKNVDEHRAKKEQPERDVSVGEHEQATDQLSQKDDDIEM